MDSVRQQDDNGAVKRIDIRWMRKQGLYTSADSVEGLLQAGRGRTPACNVDYLFRYGHGIYNTDECA
jgi:hypothetical protein